MNDFYNKLKVPACAGRYWVLTIEIVKTEGSTRTKKYSDAGYAKWDGEKWDREDWDSWYGEANLKPIPT
jgi:hypothetical protein